MNFFKETPETPSLPRKKRVTFQGSVSVILIPCVAEYIQAKLSLSIWYSEAELDQLKSSLLSDISRFIKEQADKGFVISPRDAIRLYKDAPVSYSEHIESLDEPGLVRGTPVLGAAGL